MCTNRRWVSMWATVCNQSAGKNRKTSLHHNPAASPPQNVQEHSGEWNAVHGIVYRGVEVRILLSALVICCCGTSSANFTLPLRRGRDKLAEMHLLLLLSPHSSTPCHNFTPSVSCSVVPGLTGRDDDDDVSELTPVHGIGAWGIQREMSFLRAERRGAQPHRSVSFA